MTENYPEFSQIKGAATSDVTIEGTLNADNAVRMSISAEGSAHIMSLLTDLYSDPNLAVLREYSSNAYDSHIEAGQTEPVRITLPTRFEPNFIVQDFGVGMSAETIRTIYSSYGASTKRNDFSQVGAFGLGCKAALTLTQQFTLNSVKDGIRTMAVIFRSEDGVGTVNVVSEVPTTDPNGVTVTIPIEDPYKFNQNVHKFFFTWPVGSVLVDEKAPDSLYSEDYYVIDQGHTRLALGSRVGYSIVMGGISYNLRFNDLGVSRYSQTLASAVADACDRHLHIVSEVPIGSIDLTPSREDIRYSPRTVEFLKALIEQVATEIPKFVEKQIQGAESRRDVLVKLQEWRMLEAIYQKSTGSSGNLMSIKWKGEEVPRFVDQKALRVSWSRGNYRAVRDFQTSNKPNEVEHMDLSAPHIDHYYIDVTDLDDSKRAKVNREIAFFLEHLVKTSDKYRSVYEVDYAMRFYMTTEKVTSPWILENEMYTKIKADDIFEIAKQIRKETRAKRSTGPEVMYPVFSLGTTNDGDAWLSRENVGHSSLMGDFYYIEGGASSKFDALFNRNLGQRNNLALSQFLVDIGLDANKGTKIIYVEKTRKYEALVKRTGLNFKSLYAKMTTYSQTMMNAASESDKIYATLLGFGVFSSSTLKNILNFKEVRQFLKDDNDLAEILDASKGGLDFSEKYARLESMFTSPDLGVDVTEVTDKINAVADKYLLLGLRDYHSYPSSLIPIEHYADYINMVDGKDDK